MWCSKHSCGVTACHVVCCRHTDSSLANMLNSLLSSLGLNVSHSHLDFCFPFTFQPDVAISLYIVTYFTIENVRRVVHENGSDDSLLSVSNQASWRTPGARGGGPGTCSAGNSANMVRINASLTYCVIGHLWVYSLVNQSWKTCMWWWWWWWKIRSILWSSTGSIQYVKHVNSFLFIYFFK